MTEVPTTHPGRPTAVVTGASSGIGAGTGPTIATCGCCPTRSILSSRSISSPRSWTVLSARNRAI